MVAQQFKHHPINLDSSVEELNKDTQLKKDLEQLITARDLQHASEIVKKQQHSFHFSMIESSFAPKHQIL